MALSLKKRRYGILWHLLKAQYSLYWLFTNIIILFGICLVRHTFACQRTLICRLYSVTCYAVKKSPIKEQLILIDMYALKLIIFDLRCPDRQVLVLSQCCLFHISILSGACS